MELHKEGNPLFLSITFLIIALICAVAIFREMRRANFFAVGFAGISFVVFGWFAIATIVEYIRTGGGGVPH